MHVVPRPVSAELLGGAFVPVPGTVLASEDPVAGELVRRALGPAGTGLVPGSPDAPSAVVVRLQRGPGNGHPEGYHLAVTPERVELSAAERAGLLWGAQTLRQLAGPGAFSASPAGGPPVRVPAVVVDDHPRLAWRGAHLDVARQFFPASFLHRYLELVAMHKLNVLHLHLTDDQGWRMQVMRYPLLTEVGSWRAETQVGRDGTCDGRPHGGFYTQAELAELVAHASALGVTILPEIDVPGHSLAAIASYPELGNDPGRRLAVGTRWGISQDVLNVESSTVGFYRNVLDEVMDVFPGTFVHVGGDECPKAQWRASARAQARMRELGLADEDQLQSWFISQIGGHVAAAGRRMVGWDEILEGGLAAGATVMSWRGEAGGVAAARAGHDAVMAPTTHTYFDYPQDPPGGLTLEKAYSYEPVPAELSSEEAAHVLGAQCQMWTEWVPDGPRVEEMAFPRVCAFAESVWGGREREWGEFGRRLAGHLACLDALDVHYYRG